MTKNPPPAKHLPKPATAAIKGAVQTLMLHPDRIAASPTNPRKTFPQDSLAELAQSMVIDGQVQAIIVRPLPGARAQDTFENRGDGKPLPEFELVVGERRWRAARLGDFELRAEVRELTDLEVVRVQIIENLHREEVHPLEEAEGYEYLLHHSTEQITIDQVATEVGKSRSYVYQRIKLASLCQAAREKFYAGEFDASTALLIARLPTDPLQLKAIAEIGQIRTYGMAEGDKPSYRMIRAHLAQRFHLQLATAPFDITDGYLLAVNCPPLLEGTRACTECPKRTGNQPMLFPDVDSADVCTDPDCFAAKKSAGIAAALAKARDEGLTVIEGDEARAMKPNKWADPEGKTNLNDEAYVDDDSGESVTYADLLEKAGKKAPKPIVFVDPHHPESMPDKLISDAEAAKLLKQFAPKAATKGGPSFQGANTDPAAVERAEQIDRERREHMVRYFLRAQLTNEMLAQADGPRTTHDLIVMIFALASDEISEELMLAAGVALPPDDEQRDFDHEGALHIALCGLAPAKLGAIALRLALGDLGGYLKDAIPLVALEHAARSHQIDVEGLQKKAEAKASSDSDDEEQE